MAQMERRIEALERPHKDGRFIVLLQDYESDEELFFYGDRDSERLTEQQWHERLSITADDTVLRVLYVDDWKGVDHDT